MLADYREEVGGVGGVRRMQLFRDYVIRVREGYGKRGRESREVVKWGEMKVDGVG